MPRRSRRRGQGCLVAVWCAATLTSALVAPPVVPSSLLARSARSSSTSGPPGHGQSVSGQQGLFAEGAGVSSTPGVQGRPRTRPGRRPFVHKPVAATVADAESASAAQAWGQQPLGDPQARAEFEAAVRAAAESERNFAEQLIRMSPSETAPDEMSLSEWRRRRQADMRSTRTTRATNNRNRGQPSTKTTSKTPSASSEAVGSTPSQSGTKKTKTTKKRRRAAESLNLSPDTPPELRNPMDSLFDSKLLDAAEEQSLGAIAQELHHAELVRDTLLAQWTGEEGSAAVERGDDDDAAAAAPPRRRRARRRSLEPEAERRRERLARSPAFMEAWCAACNCSRATLRAKIAGGRAARRALVAANMRLVFVLAKRHEGRGVGFSDLVQEGAIGLMCAAVKFDPARGYKFSTYAFHWIRQSLLRSLACQSRLIRLPMYVHDEVVRLHRHKVAFLWEHAREPTEAELAERLDVPPAKVRRLLDAAQRAVPVSVDDTLASASRQTGSSATSVAMRPEHRGSSPFNSFDDASGALFFTGTSRRVGRAQRQGSARNSEQNGVGPSGAKGSAGPNDKLLRVSDILVSAEPNGEAAVDMSLLHGAIHKVLADHLNDDERWVIRRRFGLEDGQRRTHHQIALEADQPKRWVKAVEASAIRKLRHPHPRMILHCYNEQKEELVPLPASSC